MQGQSDYFEVLILTRGRKLEFWSGHWSYIVGCKDDSAHAQIMVLPYLFTLKFSCYFKSAHLVEKKVTKKQREKNKSERREDRFKNATTKIPGPIPLAPHAALSVEELVILYLLYQEDSSMSTN